MASQKQRALLLHLTAKIVSAHAGRNAVSAASVPSLIQQVYAVLAELGSKPFVSALPEPAVPIKRSVSPDYIVCLEDAKKLKMLKRHLQAAYNMTVDQYREKWDLPPSYPMVAPNYAQHRSELAKKLGLGRRPLAASAAVFKGKARQKALAGKAS